MVRARRLARLYARRSVDGPVSCRRIRSAVRSVRNISLVRKGGQARGYIWDPSGCLVLSAGDRRDSERGASVSLVARGRVARIADSSSRSRGVLLPRNRYAEKSAEGAAMVPAGCAKRRRVEREEFAPENRQGTCGSAFFQAVDSARSNF